MLDTSCAAIYKSVPNHDFIRFAFDDGESSTEDWKIESESVTAAIRDEMSLTSIGVLGRPVMIRAFRAFTFSHTRNLIARFSDAVNFDVNDIKRKRRKMRFCVRLLSIGLKSCRSSAMHRERDREFLDKKMKSQ